MNSLRIRAAPGPENGNKPCSNKEGSNRTVQCVADQQWTTELVIISLMQYRTSAGLTIYRHTKSIPAETGREMHKKLNINLSQIFIIEVG